MGWQDTIELVGVVVVACLLVPVLWLFVRRRWLSSRGGVFDCALRLHTVVPSAGWALGLARYVEDGSLEWYRVFSLRVRPRLVLRRSSTEMVSRRRPDDVELLVLFADHEIVRLREEQREWELAMPDESVTGLLSWLEASPPGGQSYLGS